MTTYRILVVDDHRDVRRMIRSGLETLSEHIDVIDVPSGEEAILVISRYPIDLLITDIYLPGISGLELRERTKVRNPDIKVVLITGMMEPKIRRQVANAGADAYFFKPIEMGDLLDTVQRLLGFPSPEPATLSIGDEVVKAPETLAECLALLQGHTGAVAAALLDERGEIIVQMGALPQQAASEGMLSALVTTNSAAFKVSQLLGESSIKDLMFFPGKNHHIVLTSVGESVMLLVVADSLSWQDAILSDWLAEIRPIVNNLQGILSELGVPISESMQEESFEKQAQELAEEVDLTDVMPELEAVFEQMDQGINPEEVDAFWDTVVMEDDQAEQISRADAISYEQAQKLGLAPQDE